MTETAIVSASPFKSRWGYHACDYATYRKVKRLNHLVERTRRLAAAQWRWDRKTVHQGVRWEKIRGADGFPKGWRRIEGVPRPECPLEYAVIGHRLDMRMTCQRATIFHEWVREMYNFARIPSPFPPITGRSAFLEQLPEAMALLDRLEAWYVSKSKT